MRDGSDFREQPVPANSGPLSLLIVGSTGRMGSMLMQAAKKAGLDVRGVDQPLADEELALACAGIKFALLCVPARCFSAVLHKIVPYLPHKAILADITSVKERPMRQMEEIWSGPVVGTHPLFGPVHKAGDDLPVAIVAGKNADSNCVAIIEDFFVRLGFRVFRTTAAIHDQAMAKIQNMNFITNLAYFAVLAGQRELLPFLTPSFTRRKNAAAKMLTEDAEMFEGLFEANAYSHEAVRQYRKMLNVAASGDIELLCKRAQWWWEEGGPETSVCKK